MDFNGKSDTQNNSSTTDHNTAPALNICWSEDLPEPKPRQWLWQDIVPAGEISIFFGLAGSGKSALTMALAVHLATDQHDFLGVPLKENTGPILWLDWEMDSDEFCRRRNPILDGLGTSLGNQRLAYAKLTRTLKDKLLQTKAKVEIPKLKPDLIVLDSYGRATWDSDLNDPAPVIETFAWLQSLGSTVIVIDHAAKNGGSKSPYGSVYKTNFARSAVYFELKSMGKLTIEQTRGSFADWGKEIAIDFKYESMAFKPITGWNAVKPYKAVPKLKPPKKVDIVLAAVSKSGTAGIGVKELIENTGISKSTTYTVLSKLQSEAKITEEKGLYYVSQ